jgi:hypothetical protein
LTGPSGAIGLNWLAVESMALRVGVPEEELLDFWEKLNLISVTVLNLKYEDQERKRKQQK